MYGVPNYTVNLLVGWVHIQCPACAADYRAFSQYLSWQGVDCVQFSDGQGRWVCFQHFCHDLFWMGFIFRKSIVFVPHISNQVFHDQYLPGGGRGQPREAWLAWNFQRELWFISFFLRETWLGVPPWNVIGNLYSTWSVIKAPFSTWKNDTNRPKFAYLNDILLMHDT